VPNARGIVRQVDSIDIDLRVLSLPEGRDPDDVIRADSETWPALVRDAKPVLDHLFHVSETKRDLSQPRERSAMVAELAPFIALTADRVVQSHYLQRLARLARMDEATLRLELKAPVRGRQLPREAVPEEFQNERARSRTDDARETFCLALLFQYPELRADASGLDPGFFRQSENRALFEIWSGHAEDGAPFAGSLSPELQPHYERVLNLDLPAYDGDTAVRAFLTTVSNIEQQRMREAKRARASTLEQDSDDAAAIAERARLLRDQRGVSAASPSDEADPAAAFVEDMEAGRQIHQHLVESRRLRRTGPRGGE
jgi:hypothetical protein